MKRAGFGSTAHISWRSTYGGGRLARGVPEAKHVVQSSSFSEFVKRDPGKMVLYKAYVAAHGDRLCSGMRPCHARTCTAVIVDVHGDIGAEDPAVHGTMVQVGGYFLFLFWGGCDAGSNTVP